MYNQYYNGLYKPQDYLQPQYQSQLSLKGRPVSSFEEARAAQIDFDGSLFVFPDVANNRIYTKQIGMDGSAILKAYELTSIPQQDSGPTAAYVTKEEFNSVVEELKNSINREEPKKIVSGF